MVGAGIFAFLAEAGAVAGAAVWLASLLGYTVVKLGVDHLWKHSRMPERQAGAPVA